MSATTCSVSFDGRGPSFWVARPSMPSALQASRHFRNVRSWIPKPAATSSWVAAPTSNNDTAARRRPTTSASSQHHAAIPAKNTTPPWSSSTRSTPSLIVLTRRLHREGLALAHRPQSSTPQDRRHCHTHIIAQMPDDRERKPLIYKGFLLSASRLLESALS